MSATAESERATERAEVDANAKRRKTERGRGHREGEHDVNVERRFTDVGTQRRTWT
jgi:hypothetical protein